MGNPVRYLKNPEWNPKGTNADRNRCRKGQKKACGRRGGVLHIDRHSPDHWPRASPKGGAPYGHSNVRQTTGACILRPSAQAQPHDAKGNAVHAVRARRSSFSRQRGACGEGRGTPNRPQGSSVARGARGAQRRSQSPADWSEPWAGPRQTKAGRHPPTADLPRQETRLGARHSRRRGVCVRGAPEAPTHLERLPLGRICLEGVVEVGRHEPVRWRDHLEDGVEGRGWGIHTAETQPWGEHPHGARMASDILVAEGRCRRGRPRACFPGVPTESALTGTRISIRQEHRDSANHLHGARTAPNAPP